MSLVQSVALINAVLFFVIWMVILWAAPTTRRRWGFGRLCRWCCWRRGWSTGARRPIWRGWPRTDGRLLRVAPKVRSLAPFAALGIVGSVLLGVGEPEVERTALAIGLWFVVLAAVGGANALAIYGINAVVRSIGGGWPG